MCGICGTISPAGGPVDPGPVQAMLDGMVHRGPDAGGHFSGVGIVAGIRRLAVIDLQGGDQPIDNEDGSVSVVFNGEIYNHRELRDDLERRGHRFRTRSDTEVLVHLWEEHGPELVHRLDGMFAFCIHDRRTGESFLARDRLGIKPLFVASVSERLVFASEIGVLLRHPGLPAEVDHDALIGLFCLQYTPGDATVYRGVGKLLPGHRLHVREGAVRVDRYWSVPGGEPDSAADEERLADELRELLGASVRQRLVADVPLGAFLSGGIDSSIVVGTLAGMSDHPVRTFSVGFEGSAAFDEREHARTVAAHFATEHHELLVSPLDIARQLPRLIEHLAEPVTDPALIPTWLLSEYARREVTVVLSGEGADELFGGYRRYLYQQRYAWLARLPGARSAGRGSMGTMLPRRVEQALSAVSEADPARNHLRWSATVGGVLAASIFGDEAYADYERRTLEHFEGYFDSTRIRLADQLRADQQEWLPHNLLAKVDRASMAHSLEARVPYLDHRLVEWAARLPDSSKIRRGETKRLLKRTYRGMLPEGIVHRPKRGFDLPLAEWLRGPLRELAADLLSGEGVRVWPAADPARVAELWHEHLDGRQDHGLPLFLLVSMLLFLRGARS